MTLFDKVCIELGKVVRLTVKDDPQGLIFIGNRLVATFHIDDGEASHAQADAWFRVKAIAIRPTMENGLRHLIEELQIGRSMIGRGDTTNTTHDVISYPSWHYA